MRSCRFREHYVKTHEEHELVDNDPPNYTSGSYNARTNKQNEPADLSVSPAVNDSTILRVSGSPLLTNARMADDNTIGLAVTCDRFKYISFCS